ncbi:nuclear mitotic apparatus protein 1 isoform X2 [Hemicordylus capensis]|nr:nuclear mitotic apparatus protein 1 isoform X2 [Hemicordylus capensis]XP_053161326.1 nuclear mitotic apparatus protein 1 isoform X2 [Hemicordylus capensis]XP_053161327.1 nuclear mitotic apparatus protein 1 isoform X2 [Hemicordylus capensis]XP_053161329.1 nuclear mitotic apparatus protein 1 isoform X2 [Hemicordylus capensis]
MSLHSARASALLAWVNSLTLGDPLNALSQLQDCSIFIKIISKIHGTEEGQAVLQQSMSERVAYVSSFLEKRCKHRSTTQSLVSEEKLLAGEELELAKVVMLLLYHASMSDKIPKEWATVEYNLQAEMAKFLNFMLYNEECLGENLENFLRKKMPEPASICSSSTSSEESTPPKREVKFLRLQKVASSSSMNKFLPGSSASPMGDIMQTPQFQMRRLKKLLEAERENRDELEHELAENRKLIDEKDTRIQVMKQRIDRLSLLQERQAADQLEPKEMEELREKNESLLMRLHETLKQCQDLKTEKGQMDRKIGQLSEENGDLTFRLREFASALTEVQEMLNELSEEHNTALKEWEERRACLESELHQALTEKKCLEEKLEILQGKISMLEDQLTKLKESSSLPEKGEVMGDVLKLEDLNQQVASLSSKQAELQATTLRLEEEKRHLEASLQSERSSFAEEKLQLTGLLTSLQNSSLEISRAKEKLEQDSRAQEELLAAQVSTLTAEIAKLTSFLHQKDQELLALHQQVEAERNQKGQLAEDLQKNEQVSRVALQELSLQVDQLSNTLRQSHEKLTQVEAASQEEYNKIAQEKELVVRQLQEKETELSALSRQLRSLEQAQDSSAADAQREKAELSQKVQELDARILALTAQCQQSEAQAGAASALKIQLREAQQKLAEKEKLSKENSRLQERLLVLEESVRNTEGILEDEKRRAAESLEGNLRRIAELEEQVQELARHRDQAAEDVGQEKARRQALEGQVQPLRAKAEALERQLAELSSAAQGGTGERGKLEGKVQALSAEREQALQQLEAEARKVAELERQAKRLSAQHQEALARLRADLHRAAAQVKEKEGAEEKLRAEVASLQEKLAAAHQEAARGAAKAKKDEQETALALEAASRDLTEERLERAELEAKVKQLREQSQKDLAAAEAKISSTRAAAKEKERELEQLSGQVRSLRARLEEATQQHKRELALRDEEAKRLAGEEERAKAELATEKASKAALEVQLQNVSNELRVEVSGLQEEVARAREFVEEKERELEELRLKNVSRNEELRDLQKTVSKLKGELASVEALKERAAKMESELQGFLEVARTREAEMDSIKAIIQSKDLSLRSLEEESRRREQEATSSRERCEEKRKECEVLGARVEKLEQQCKEQQSTIGKLEKVAASSAEAEALKRDVVQHKGRAAELERLLEASRSAQESAVEKLKRELLEKGKELAQSREAASGAEKELASLRASAQEKGKSEESWKEQMARCRQEAERKASLISSLEQEMSIMHRQLLEKEAESKDLRRLVLAESEKSKKLEERLRLLQSEMATAASRAAERCSAMKAEAQSSGEQVEKLRLSSEALKKELGAFSKREEDLCKELKSWQEKAFQKEQLLSTRQQELAGAQALVTELMPLKRLYQQLQAEQASQESKHREEMEQLQAATGVLQAELARTKLELPELRSAQERLLEQERGVQQLQAEKASYAEQLATLQRAHAQLAEENRALTERSNHGLQRLDAELLQAKQKHTQELEAARRDSEKLVALSKREAEEAQQKVEAVTSQYEEAKQKLQVQVEQLEARQKERAKQVEELKQKLAQQEKAARGQQQRAKVHEEELQAEMKEQSAKVAELHAQLAQKEQAAEHYKAQMEKAKTHYDAKKQQNQELAEKLKGLEQREKENAELKAESERLAKELKLTSLQAKESELRCKSLTSRVHSLEAQVEFADRQLRDQGKFQLATDPLKSREAFQRSPADISTDSLDLSTSDEAQPLNSTSRKTRRSLSESGSADTSKASHRLPSKVESLESLYFTPIPTRARSKVENNVGGSADTPYESGRKTLSARRRTTQVIDITLTKKHPEPEELSSANASFFSMHSAGSQASAPSQESVKTRLRSASSSRSLASLPSQESLARLGSSSSPEDAAGNAALMSLPGYRPATRSSLRRSQSGGAAGRRSLYVDSCQDEPDQLEGWGRIMELQQRNQVCQPHLKTCYPLESRPSQSLLSITDEEMKTGDPKETLRRATLLPSQIAEGPTTRRSSSSTLSSSWAAGGGVATRQQRKRVSNEPPQGLGTPEAKKSASCFPRPQTPKGRNEERKQNTLAGGKKTKTQAADKQSERRQSLAFSILNTPKKLGNSLLRRGANRKVTPKSSPQAGSRRSPRAATSPKGKVAGLAGAGQGPPSWPEQACQLQVVQEQQVLEPSFLAGNAPEGGKEQGTDTPPASPHAPSRAARTLSPSLPARPPLAPCQPRGGRQGPKASRSSPRPSCAVGAENPACCGEGEEGAGQSPSQASLTARGPSPNYSHL